MAVLEAAVDAFPGTAAVPATKWVAGVWAGMACFGLARPLAGATTGCLVTAEAVEGVFVFDAPFVVVLALVVVLVAEAVSLGDVLVVVDLTAVLVFGLVTVDGFANFALCATISALSPSSFFF